MEDGEEGNRNKRYAAGRGTQGFFSDVVNGSRDIPNLLNFRPELDADELYTADGWFAEVLPGQFDAHIACSIPTYFELVRAIAFGVVAHHRARSTERHVDLGASEGTLCAAIALGSDEGIQTFAVEPNLDMVDKIICQPLTVHTIVNALDPQPGSVVFDAEAGAIPVYPFNLKPDYYTELMTFQFLGSEREAYITKISQDLPEHGIFISCEKFSQSSLALYLQLEAIKDGFKARFFEEEELIRKQREVLASPEGGMDSGMVTPEAYEAILLDSFDYVARFWDAGNFKGYVASNDYRSIELFLSLIPSLNSRYSTAETPFFVEL